MDRIQLPYVSCKECITSAGGLHVAAAPLAVAALLCPLYFCVGWREVQLSCLVEHIRLAAAGVVMVNSYRSSTSCNVRISQTLVGKTQHELVSSIMIAVPNVPTVVVGTAAGRLLSHHVCPCCVGELFEALVSKLHIRNDD
jgi:hypothetical protein